MQHADMSELDRAVELGEQIKKILADASEIKTLSFNSVFLARRVGEQARGFDVISKELRELSDELRHTMLQLAQTRHRLVVFATQALRRERQAAIVERVLRKGPRAAQCWGSARAQSLAEERSGVAALRGLQRALEETIRTCSFAVAVARLAKIESAYSGEHALRDASVRFDAQLSGILSRLTGARLLVGSHQ